MIERSKRKIGKNRRQTSDGREVLREVCVGIGSDRERYSAHCGEGRVDRRDMLLLSLTRTQRKRRRVVASARKREKAASGTSRLSLSSPRPPEERYRRRGVGISYQRLVVRLRDVRRCSLSHSMGEWVAWSEGFLESDRR